MIIKAEADGTMPQAEILDSQEDENDKDTEVEGND